MNTNFATMASVATTRTIDWLEYISQALIDRQDAICYAGVWADYVLSGQALVDTVQNVNLSIAGYIFDAQEWLDGMTAEDWQELATYVTTRIVRAIILACFHIALFTYAIAQFVWEHREEIKAWVSKHSHQASDAISLAARTVNGVSSGQRELYSDELRYQAVEGRSLLEWVRMVLLGGFRAVRCAPRQTIRFAQWFWMGV